MQACRTDRTPQISPRADAASERVRRRVRRPGWRWLVLGALVACEGAADAPTRTLRPGETPADALRAPVAPGTTIEIPAGFAPLEDDTELTDLRGTPEAPIVLRGDPGEPAVLRGRLVLRGAAHVRLEHLIFEPESGREPAAAPWVDLEGESVELADAALRGTPGDALRLSGPGVRAARVRIDSAAGTGVRVEGGATLDGATVVSGAGPGVRAAGTARIVNCILRHNRGPALWAGSGATLLVAHNLFYNNSGGARLEDAAGARVFNNIFFNNYATVLLGDDDVELAVAADGAQVDYNVYFRHPARDQLLRGLPYAQGVDLAPLAADNPFGLRRRAGGQWALGATPDAWSGYDRHSLVLDILQRFTGAQSYTRSYEDLFEDLSREDFRPRFSSPAVGRGLDLTVEISRDATGRPRSAARPDIGPHAAPAGWWAEIDAGRATVVDAARPLDADGRDTGLGTVAQPYSTLSKALAFARRGVRVYVRDGIYRDAAIRTTFCLGPDAVLSGWPGHRPAFSPSESIAPDRWKAVTDDGLYRARDWHTFVGRQYRMNGWAQDWHGNLLLGGAGENVSRYARSSARRAEPFRILPSTVSDRDTPQVLAGGVALQLAGGVLGLEDFRIGTMSAWGRDPAHLRPGSFMVGRRDFLLSRAVAPGEPEQNRPLRQGPNPEPQHTIRVGEHAAGYVSEFLAADGTDWIERHAYANGDRLWQLSPALCARFGRRETRRLTGWRVIRADSDSSWWARTFALPVFDLRAVGGPSFERHPGAVHRNQLPVGAWRQRQAPTGDPAMAAVFDLPYEDYLEIRLPAGLDPNAAGLDAAYFSARVEAVWRRTQPIPTHPGINQAGVAMLGAFRTMETGADDAATAASARAPWQFGFLVPIDADSPVLTMRMPGDVNPNEEDPWRFTVVDDCLYVRLLPGADPVGTPIEAANHSGIVSGVPGSNPLFDDWEPAGPLRPEWPALTVYRTELDFDRDAARLWPEGRLGAPSPGFSLDVDHDAEGRTVRLDDAVRLDPGSAGDPILWVTYFEGDPDAPVRREHPVAVGEVGPDRRVRLPSLPVSFPDQGALSLAPADRPAARIRQDSYTPLRPVATRDELRPGTGWYDAEAGVFYVCAPAGRRPVMRQWRAGPGTPWGLVRGVYSLGGNAYGHQKQTMWSSGLGGAAMRYEDVVCGFSTGGQIGTVPGSVLRGVTFRWTGAEVGRGGALSGDVRHTADRIQRPELHIDRCVFDVGNAFLFDGNDNPTKNIPFANHHIWENSWFLSAHGGVMGPWWDQYCFNNIVQNNIFAGRGGVDVEVAENAIVRNNIFATDKGSFVTFRGADRGYVFNNTTFRGGGVWYTSEPRRANSTQQGQPTYGAPRPVTERGVVPWLAIDRLGHERGFSISAEWRPLDGHDEVFFCPEWDFPDPRLIDAAAFEAYRPAPSVAAMERGTYVVDLDARRLYLRTADGSAPGAGEWRAPFIPQTDRVRRDLVYTLTVVRAGRLSHPHRWLADDTLELTEMPPAGSALTVRYHDADGQRVEPFEAAPEALARGRLRWVLPTPRTGGAYFIGRAGEAPPRVRVTGSWNDVAPFETDLLPGERIRASALMGLDFRVRDGASAGVREGETFESVLHSRSILHLASRNNAFLDGRSHTPSDAMYNQHHGANYLLNTEQTDRRHMAIDHNAYWKDLQAVPGPLSAYIQIGGTLEVWESTGVRAEGLTLDSFAGHTGFASNSLAPPSYFSLFANPLRFDFRPLPESPLLGAGVVETRQVGSFLFDPDEGNDFQTFTYKGNARDFADAPRGDPPTIGALEHPQPGARAWHVAPGGRDAPEGGTRDAPLATPQYGLDRMRPGDVLILHGGVYPAPLVVRRSGTARDFLHIIAKSPPYPGPDRFPHGAPAVLDASGAAAGPALLLEGCAHVRVAGLRVVGATGAAAVELRDTRDCVLEYVYVEAPAGAAFRVTGRGNTLYECRALGGAVGFEFAGSLGDLRGCAAEGSDVGFRAVGPLAGWLLLQNRHLEGRVAGYEIAVEASDLTFDGNWADPVEGTAYRVSGRRVMLVNNIADAPARGFDLPAGSDLRVFHNAALRAGEFALRLGAEVHTALALNNVWQSQGPQLEWDTPAPVGSVWSDYNLFTRATFPFGMRARQDGAERDGLEAWRSATGFDHRSRVAPLIYHKIRDRNGRWRIRPRAISVSNFTPHYNTDRLGANAWPYAGGGTYILNLPANWQPWGDPERGVYRFGVEPFAGALAPRGFWYAARVDYLRTDGTRQTRALARVETSPEALPPGTFCQDSSGVGVWVRLPSDAADPRPVAPPERRALSDALDYFVAVGTNTAMRPFWGQRITPALARRIADAGFTEIETAPHRLSAVLGTAMIEQGAPILGIVRDADSARRPSVPGALPPYGKHHGPGRFDVGPWEGGYFVP